MTTTEALKIIQSLADGRCPITGQSLDGRFQQPEVVRALFIAAKALERVERIERRSGSLPDQAGRAWTVDEEQQLCAEFDSGKTITEISQIHRRTRGGIQRRLERMGKILPAGRSDDV